MRRTLPNTTSTECRIVCMILSMLNDSKDFWLFTLLIGVLLKIMTDVLYASINEVIIVKSGEKFLVDSRP